MKAKAETTITIEMSLEEARSLVKWLRVSRFNDKNATQESWETAERGHHITSVKNTISDALNNLREKLR